MRWNFVRLRFLAVKFVFYLLSGAKLLGGEIENFTTKNHKSYKNSQQKFTDFFYPWTFFTRGAFFSHGIHRWKRNFVSKEITQKSLVVLEFP